MAKKKKINLTTQWKHIFFGVPVLFALGYLSWWSFIQSQKFLTIFDGAVEGGISVSYIFAAVVQYGQSIVLWLGMQERNRLPLLKNKVDEFEAASESGRGDKKRFEKLYIQNFAKLNSVVRTMWAWFLLYALFLGIDIFSNIGQFLNTSGEILFLASAVGILGVILVAFVEEIMPGIATAVGSAINDIREANGKSRVTSFDGFKDEILEEFSPPNNKKHQGKQSQYKKPQQQQRQQSRRSEQKIPLSKMKQRELQESTDAFFKEEGFTRR